MATHGVHPGCVAHSFYIDNEVINLGVSQLMSCQRESRVANASIVWLKLWAVYFRLVSTYYSVRRAGNLAQFQLKIATRMCREKIYYHYGRT
jgi:hypothetical protein